MTENDIIEICNKYNIENYTINSDMSVDVDGDVDISHNNLSIIPLNFGKVTGLFDCSHNNLTSLKGCPNYVGVIFYCNNNSLTSLEYCPNYVDNTFYCDNNQLTSLKELPINFHIGNNFYCNNNNITSPIEYGRLFFGIIIGVIQTGYNNLNIFLNEHKNPPKKDLPRLLSELRKITL